MLFDTTAGQTQTTDCMTAVANKSKTLPLEQGLQLLRDGDFVVAIATLEEALEQEPGRFAAVRGLATAYLLNGEPHRSQELLSRFCQYYPMTAAGWRLAAQLEWKLGRRTSAFEVIQAGLTRLPQSKTLHQQLSEFQSLNASNVVAHTDSRPCSRISSIPSTPPASDKSTTASDTDWLDQIAADPAFLWAILAPDSPVQEAISIESRDMLKGVERKLISQLDAQPLHADRHLQLARLQNRLGDVCESMRSVDRALGLNSQLATAKRLKAQLHGQIGEFAEAIEILNSLLKAGLCWPDIYGEIAEFERRCARAPDARSHLDSAICLNPHFKQAKQLLVRTAA